ncbi:MULTISPECIES: serine/threonine-protein kinase [unclassified Coleofasciculus]|uniref:serine/threonine-protein kinase n=1 Tax=unclassified Coleofasciculus TaxID=2692782 RepID=UPI0018825941|nr:MULTISPECIES: serine/threonine-protein kinase [unclassified Coleofasciculus]MBE9128155.1 serine/threonine protein kinase [Coleofasciculus sp. LEGE 07081]MBE9151246.1 serine/threonine protein kinase [Coleofasciculus sp. LEGE 07092]
MSYCLNPNCFQRQNPHGMKFCQSCGGNLLLKERYRAMKLIGQGGFGRTFLAVDEDKPSKPYCVIKQFYPQAQGTDNEKKAAKLFEQEAVRLDDLGYHPQIPQLQAHFGQDSRQYLVQEFIEGQNLAEVLATEKAFNEQQIRDLLNSLLSVLDFIHGHNIIHRDIKPANIIRRAKGNGTKDFFQAKQSSEQLVLVDFGAAKFATITALTRKGTAIGSAGYAAPEQALGQAFFASDLYSLGVTCIHLLTQRHPLEVYCVNEGDWVWRNYSATSVSTHLGQILDKLLQRPIRKRYQSAKDVLQDLNPRPTSVHQGNSASLKAIALRPIAKVLSLSKTWQCLHTLKGHSSSVCSVAISPDGQWLASGSFDKTIKLWNPQRGELLHTLTRHSQPVLAVAFSPNGQLLVSGSVNDTIDLWNLSTGIVSCTFADHSDAIVSISIAISPDGQLLASGSDRQTIKIWQVDSGQLLNTLSHARGINAIAFSPDGQLLASGSSDNTIKLWQINNGQLITTLVGHERDVNSVAIDPQSKILASASSDNTIKVWYLGNFQLLRTLEGHSDWVRTVVFSPNRQMLISGSADATIRLWDLRTGKILATLTGHSKDVNSIAISRKGQMIVSGSRDGTIKIWGNVSR